MFDAFTSPEDGFEIEEAITFLVAEYAKSGHNPKPVILHSLRVAFFLLEHGQPKQVVIAAVLHDLLEDTKVQEGEIENKFGTHVLELVTAVTQDETIQDETERYKELFARAIAAGPDAIAIKNADLHFNSLYTHLVQDEKKRESLEEKQRWWRELDK